MNEPIKYRPSDIHGSVRAVSHALAGAVVVVTAVVLAAAMPVSASPSDLPNGEPAHERTGEPMVAPVAMDHPDTDESDEFDCLIVPNALVDLGVEVQGVIDEIHVDRGERVAKGQTLAALRATVERANLQQALDRVSMDSEIAARKADLEFTRQVFERQKSLLAQKLGPQQSLDEARARYRVAEAALRRARDNAALDRHELLRHEALLHQRFVVSPIDGVVIRRHAEPGELVIDAPVLTVAELDILRVEVVLPATELHRFAPGERAVVYPETTPGLGTDAVITAIDPMLDAASGTFGVRLTLDNAGGSVVAGQECRVRFAGVPPAG